MSDDKLPTYDSLLGHIKHHNIRKWLLDGAEREEANTIRAAIKRLSDGDLNRRFARMLAKGDT
jgi:hypothetical protein